MFDDVLLDVIAVACDSVTGGVVDNELSSDEDR